MSETPAPATNAAAQDEGLTRDVLAVASVVVLGAVMSILDVTVVNVAIKALSEDFNSPLSTIQWVATGYTLALATVIPLSAWGSERFGTKRLYMMSILLFTLGSILCGFAWNDISLIAFRVLQGFGGGLIMPVGMTILTRKAGPNRVGRVMAVIGVPMLLGPIAGPILGGWLVDTFSWHWIFFINVPIGLFALYLAQRILPQDVAEPNHKLDLVGLALLSPSLALMIYGLAESSTEGGFGHAQVLVPLVLGVAGFFAFLWHATHTEAPLLDLKLYRNKVFAAASATLFLMIVAVFGGMLLMPLYLQTVRGESAFDTGLLLAPQGLGAMIAMPIAGMLTDKTGVGRIVPVGLLMVALSFLGLTQLAGDTSYVTFGAYLFLMGLGMGFTMMPTMSGAMQTLRHANIPSASTTMNIVQQVGASFGTAVLSILLTRYITTNLATLPQQGGAPAGGEGGGFATDISALPAQLQELVRPLLADAFGTTFWWALGLVIVAGVVAVVLLPQRKPEPLAPEDDAQAAAAVLLH